MTQVLSTMALVVGLSALPDVVPLQSMDQGPVLPGRGSSSFDDRAAVQDPASVDLSQAPRSPEQVAEQGDYDLPVVLNRLVLHYVRGFLNRYRSSMARYLARSGRYEAMIERHLEANGLPRDLFYVALVESGFSPRALSPARAAGIWQFVPRTARIYRLRVDRWVDERLDPERSTEAAVSHLADLYDHFGAWDLALAAYNGGIGRVSSAIKRYGTNRFWTLARYEYLPRSTVNYVAKVLAAVIVGHHRDEFGFDHLKYEHPPEVVEVTPKPGTSLRDLAKRLRVPVGELEELNPWLLRKVVPPSGPMPRLLVPARVAHRVPEALRDTSERVFLRHEVLLGDDLRSLARRYGVPAGRIARLNGITSDEDLLPGGVLLIPRGRPTGRARAATDPERPRKKKKTKRVPVVVSPTSFDYPDRRKVFFVLPSSRLELEQVAETFGVTPDEIRTWNDLDLDARLRKGMALRLYVPSGIRPKARYLTPGEVKELVRGTEGFEEELDKLTSAWKVRRRSRRWRYHRVRKGETLSGIAAQYGLGPEEVARANPIRPDRLRAGQVIRIPRRARRGRHHRHRR